MNPVLLVAGAVAFVAFLWARSTGKGDALPAGASSVAACRAAVPVEKGLVPTSAMLGGSIYAGNDPAHRAYLAAYLDAKAAAATGETRRAILAFKALLSREGSTAAINTYDSQILTWGTGWGGLGGLPGVMDRLVTASPAVVAALAACGVRYLSRGRWAVDDGTGQIVTGQADALQVIRKTPALLNLLIKLAKDPATRDAVTDAQLGAFVAGSGNLRDSAEIATQALYNLAAHLKHWAPAYLEPRGASAITQAARQAPGAPSEARDRLLAPLIMANFYANAPPGSYPWKQWKQAQGYALRDMKADGLDMTGDSVLSANAPPGGAVA